MALCEEGGIKTVPTGIDHGTVTAVIDGKPFEITTLRKDIETDGRHATVTFTDQWEEDARRRDFTMNTLLADLDGHIYDPLGRGLADLDAQRVVFVGEAEARIKEDYLRILRFFRFHAWYGEGEMDKAALNACTALAPEMSQLSKERITQEVLKLLKAKSPVETLSIINKNNILPALFHSKYNEKALMRYYGYGRTDEAAALLILSGLDENHMAKLESIMVLSNVIKKRYAKLAACLRDYTNDDEGIVKRIVYYEGNDIALQYLQIRGSESAAAFDRAQNWQAPVFPVTGEQLIAEGYAQGPALGQKLKELEEQWIENGFSL